MNTRPEGRRARPLALLALGFLAAPTIGNRNLSSPIPGKPGRRVAVPYRASRRIAAMGTILDVEMAAATRPTVGALVEAWGLREGGRRAPSPDEIARARRLSAPDLVELGPHGVRRLDEVRLDAGGFGKGVALDEAAEEALAARAKVDDAARLNEALGLAGTDSVGSRLTGYYVQAGYDVLAGRSGDRSLTPYVRWEHLNTQDEVPGGSAADPRRRCFCSPSA